MTRIKEAKRRKQLKKRIVEDLKFTVILSIVVIGFFAVMFGYWLIFGYAL